MNKFLYYFMLPKTIKEYYEKPYSKEFKAMVLETNGEKVVLDKTLFYPGGGGQACDVGKLNGFEVYFVNSSDGVIFHHVREHNLRKGDVIKGEIDWERRYELMKLHSAAHIVYYKFIEVFFNGDYEKAKVIGSNVAVSKSRIDFAMQESIAEKLVEVEKLSNEFIKEAHEIITKYLDAEKRVWVCDKYEMPCGGTHVKNTSEIGEIKLKRKNLGKGKERVEIMLA